MTTSNAFILKTQPKVDGFSEVYELTAKCQSNLFFQSVKPETLKLFKDLPKTILLMGVEVMTTNPPYNTWWIRSDSVENDATTNKKEMFIKMTDKILQQMDDKKKILNYHINFKKLTDEQFDNLPMNSLVWNLKSTKDQLKKEGFLEGFQLTAKCQSDLFFQSVKPETLKLFKRLPKTKLSMGVQYNISSDYELRSNDYVARTNKKKMFIKMTNEILQQMDDKKKILFYHIHFEKLPAISRNYNFCNCCCNCNSWSNECKNECRIL
jgi:hypothetical protein